MLITRQIPLELAGDRLDQAVAKVFPEYSRSRLKEWFDTGFLKIEPSFKRSRDKVSGNETILLDLPEQSNTIWQPEPVFLNIIFEDDSILVINKPRGLVVHPAAGHTQGTLVNALLYHAKQLENIPRAGIIHRLDKDTSGLLVVAKTLKAHHKLTKQLQKRTIHREYRAIVQGVMTAGGTIDEPLGRHPHSRTQMAVVSDGKEAITHYRVLERFNHHTYLKVFLETGRTHQIRVHLAHIRYPILGDKTYNHRGLLPRNCSDYLKHQLKGITRQALHAYRLEFIHPESDEPVSFNSEIPDDIQNILSALRKDTAENFKDPDYD